jgi:hypothetical protein
LNPAGFFHEAAGGKTVFAFTLTKEEDLNARNCQFKFHKRSQLFIGVHNETLSVVTMRVCDPDCSTVGAASFKLA